jgi:hypothetical protein
VEGSDGDERKALVRWRMERHQRGRVLQLRELAIQPATNALGEAALCEQAFLLECRLSHWQPIALPDSSALLSQAVKIVLQQEKETVSAVGAKGCTFALSVSWQDPWHIGFYVAKTDGSGYRVLSVAPDDLVAKVQFSNTREVTTTVQLADCSVPLVVIPCTFKPGQGFLLPCRFVLVRSLDFFFPSYRMRVSDVV